MLDKVDPDLITKFEALETLEKLDALFDTPDKWHQGHCAKTKDGMITGVFASDAHSFCVIGGLARVSGGNIENVFYSASANIFSYTIGKKWVWIPTWNDADDTTFEDVKENLAKAIKNARELLR